MNKREYGSVVKLYKSGVVSEAQVTQIIIQAILNTIPGHDSFLCETAIRIASERVDLFYKDVVAASKS